MFGFFGKKSGSTSNEPLQKVSSSLASTILQTLGTKSIPTMPGSAQKAFSLSVDPNADAKDFVQIIESDESLSARILKVSNSVYFDRGHRSKTIDEAVTVIGISELRSLLNATSLSSIFPSTHPYRKSSWANDIATGIIAKELAKRLVPQMADNAFLAGLMHDIGKLFLLQRNREEYEKIVKKVEQTGIPFHTIELERFPFDHTEVGQLIAEKWNFTEDLTRSIRFHHLSFSDYSSPKELPALIQCADIFAHALSLGIPKQFFKLRSTNEEKIPLVLEFLSIPQKELPDLQKNFHRLFSTEYDLYAGGD